MTQQLDDPCDPPSAEILGRLSWAMTLVRDLASTPAAGDRVRHLLVALRDHHRASGAAARVESADEPSPSPLDAIGWEDAADLARARYQIGVRTGELLVDVLPLDGRRAVRLELFRRDAPPFRESDAAWLAVMHAGCAWSYGERVETPTSRRVRELSPRDRRTLEHLLAGESEKQIAARIGRSPHTVHTHVKRIYRRLGVSSRAELLARCLR